MLKQKIVEYPELQLVGITARTSNAAEFNPETAKIGATVQQYFQNGLSDKIPHRSKPGTTYCVYTDYENKHHGEYTYFIGEAVSETNELPEGFSTCVIPKQFYAQHTTEPGPMPAVVINAWQRIWAMSPAELGGERSYKADFELYDERATSDPTHQKVVVDVCIGIDI
ncbi:MAG: GyrI-like domain-containing protein [Pseudomonadota bacterium]